MVENIKCLIYISYYYYCYYYSFKLTFSLQSTLPIAHWWNWVCVVISLYSSPPAVNRRKSFDNTCSITQRIFSPAFHHTLPIVAGTPSASVSLPEGLKCGRVLCGGFSDSAALLRGRPLNTAIACYCTDPCNLHTGAISFNNKIYSMGKTSKSETLKSNVESQFWDLLMM